MAVYICGDTVPVMITIRNLVTKTIQGSTP